MKKFSLNLNIVMIMSVFVLGSMVISYVGLSGLREMNDSMTNIVGTLVKRLRIANQLRAEFRAVALTEKNFILENTKEGMHDYAKLLEEHNELIRNKIDEGIKVGSEEGKVKLANFREIYDEWWKVSSHIQALAADGKDAEAFALTKEKGAPLRLKAEKISQELIDGNQSKMDAADTQADVDYDRARNLVFIISFLAIGIGAGLAFVILRSVSGAINRVIADLGDSSSQVSSAAGQIAASSEELSQANAEQAAAIEQTAAAIEEMTSMIGKNAENARRAAEQSLESQDNVARGKSAVEDMMRAIEEINRCNNQVADIVKVIGDIGNKTKVINDIVFQTKLLSFNASVEAARAGENGKGFAVVAEEVGKLAAMSGNAAREITEMLEGSMKKVEGIVYEAKSRVETGTQVARQCGDALEGIVTSVTSVREMAGEISTASREQAQGIQEITKAMNQLDEVTQQNAATSEEAAGAAEELSGQSESLLGVVQTLIVAIKGEGSTEAARLGTGTKVIGVGTYSKSDKVVPFRKKSSLTSASSSQKTIGMKKVANGSLPEHSDPRFEDV